MTELDYIQAHRDFLEVLTEMKRSIDRYEQKEDVNKEWLAKRKEQLAVIYQYSKIAHRTCSIAQEQTNRAYTDGYRRGAESVERKYTQPESIQELRARLGNEGFRRYHNNIKMTKWADLYFPHHEHTKTIKNG